MERSAHATLRLRAFYRLLREREGEMPRVYADYLSAVAQGRAQPAEIHFGDGPIKSLGHEDQAEARNRPLGGYDYNATPYERIERVLRNARHKLTICTTPVPP